jgi:hypothetical protein
MLTTGKISEGNLTSTNTKRISAHLGKRRISFPPMQMAASMSTDANTRMDGKNKNTILSITKCMHADKLMCARSPTVPTSILIKIGDNLSVSTSKYFPRIEVRQ